MPLFSYTAIESGGREIAGSRRDGSAKDVEEWLQSQGQYPVSITDVSENETQPDTQPKSNFWQRRSITIDDRILICRQMATMLKAGVPILQALLIMGRQSQNKAIAELLLDVSQRIEEGANLSDAFSLYPRFASTLFLNIIRVGEETGTLDQSFGYLAELYENEKEVNERIKAATRYPQIVITAILAATFFLMSFVVPRFVTIFENAHIELPLPTKILIAISSFTTSYFWFILAFLVISIMGYRYAMRQEPMKYIRDNIWLQVPIFGGLALKIYMSRFCRVFSLLQKSGVNVIRTLELSVTALENLVLFDAVDKLSVDVRQGSELHKAMEGHKLFPDMVVQMVAIGEQAGQVDEMMAKVAEYYERETNYMVRNLSTLIEPLLLLVMGVMVGFLALSIYLPMWDMMSVVRS